MLRRWICSSVTTSSANSKARGSFVREIPQLRTLAFISGGMMAASELQGMSKAAFARGYHLQILLIDVGFRQLEHYLQASLESGVEAFIIYARENPKTLALYAQLLARGIPLVFIDRYYASLKNDHVVYNDEESSYQLTEKLILKGHQRIALVSGCEVASSAVRARILGYQRLSPASA
ncbi:MAG: substrate-binding domain-containing protein [Deinococcales bacterium]